MRCSTTVDGPVNGDIFEAFVQHVLVECLRPCGIVVMDNLSSHKNAKARRLIDSARTELLFLPPYSPHLNTIQPAFSKIKQLLRSLAARTREALWSSMQNVLDAATANDARGYFKHCGYTLQQEQERSKLRPDRCRDMPSHHYSPDLSWMSVITSNRRRRLSFLVGSAVDNVACPES